MWWPISLDAMARSRIESQNPGDRKEEQGQGDLQIICSENFGRFLRRAAMLEIHLMLLGYVQLPGTFKNTLE